MNAFTLALYAFAVSGLALLVAVSALLSIGRHHHVGHHGAQRQGPRRGEDRRPTSPRAFTCPCGCGSETDVPQTLFGADGVRSRRPRPAGGQVDTDPQGDSLGDEQQVPPPVRQRQLNETVGITAQRRPDAIPDFLRRELGGEALTVVGDDDSHQDSSAVRAQVLVTPDVPLRTVEAPTDTTRTSAGGVSGGQAAGGAAVPASPVRPHTRSSALRDVDAGAWNPRPDDTGSP